jgi:hypothetical protein
MPDLAPIAADLRLDVRRPTPARLVDRARDRPVAEIDDVHVHKRKLCRLVGVTQAFAAELGHDLMMRARERLGQRPTRVSGANYAFFGISENGFR